MIADGCGAAADRLLPLVRPAVRLRTRPDEDDGLPTGASKIGGAPDLPSPDAWPIWKSRPLSFLAQLNLADLAPFACCDVLPRSGLLQFFYVEDQSTWGFDPADRGSWAVRFEPDPGPLDRVHGAALVYSACRLQFVEVMSAPPWESADVAALGLSDVERDSYLHAVDDLERRAPDEPMHQVLGQPRAVQGDMQLECQLVSHGLYCGDASGYTSAAAAALQAGAVDWRLLLQLESDDAADMMWGDLGALYFWMTTGAMAGRRFDEAWMICQSH
jgi:uncharacterized protein YwqG